MKNLEIAGIFNDIADLLEIKGENPFKIRAYRKVSQNLESFPGDIKKIYEEGKLKSIPGIGEGIAEKISELLIKGRLQYYEDLKKEIPLALTKLLRVPEVGPKTAYLLYDKLGIVSLEELKKKAQEHKLSNLPGLSQKSEEKIIRGLKLLKERDRKLLLGIALPLTQSIVRTLEETLKIGKISPAGSIRRGKETIGDVDILVSSPKSEKVMEAFTTLPQVKEVLSKGTTKSSILTEENIQVDLRVVERGSFGSALHYFTGSKAHNIRIREIALKKGLKVNEYGIFKGKKKIGGGEEEEIFQAVGLPFIPPELREDRGEIEAAQERKLPQLVKESDIKGDLHVHTDWSDGANSILEMAEAAKARGYEYLAITDHSQSIGVAQGLKEERLRKQIKEIRNLNRRLKSFYVLTGTEMNIKSDGRLDYPEKLLRELDLVIGAIHTGFQQDRETLTKRIIRAMESGLVDVIAHPTGRLLQKREPYEVDLKEVIESAAKTETFLEINAFPERLELDDIHSRMAKEAGVLLTLGTDAHRVEQLGMMELGVAVARRGWLEKKDLLNSLPLSELKKSLGAGRRG